MAVTVLVAMGRTSVGWLLLKHPAKDHILVSEDKMAIPSIKTRFVESYLKLSVVWFSESQCSILSSNIDNEIIMTVID